MNYMKEYEKLLNEYVPFAGKAETEGGEILRAVSDIEYSLCNNGDYFWYYAGDTCGSSAIYLLHCGSSKIADWVYRNTGKKYGKKEIKELIMLTLDLLEKHPELFERINSRDSQEDYRKETESLYKIYQDGVP